MLRDIAKAEKAVELTTERRHSTFRRVILSIFILTLEAALLKPSGQTQSNPKNAPKPTDPETTSDSAPMLAANAADLGNHVDSEHRDELPVRAVEAVDRLLQRGDAGEEQMALKRLGTALAQARRDRRERLEVTAQRIGITPARLSFLEMGFASAAEFHQVIDQWARALELEAAHYRSTLPPLVSEEVNKLLVF